MIAMHIVDYLAIIISDAIQYFYDNRSLRAFEISTICLMAISFVSSLIFALIVNTIVTKIVDFSVSDTDALSLSSDFAGSF
jgi:hypothetical protein